MRALTDTRETADNVIRHSFALIAQAPPDLPLGPAAVILQVDDIASEPFPIEVVPSNLGIYTTGFIAGPARAANGLTKPAASGDILTLWGTGLGQGKTEITASVMGATTTGDRIITCAAPAASGRITLPSADLAPFDPTDPGAATPAMRMVGLSTGLGVIRVPYTSGDPIRTTIWFSTTYFTGIRLR